MFRIRLLPRKSHPLPSDLPRMHEEMSYLNKRPSSTGLCHTISRYERTINCVIYLHNKQCWLVAWLAGNHLLFRDFGP
jgi:hypothetical protein